MKLAKGTIKRIAEEFGVSSSLVSAVALGKRRNVRISMALEKAKREQDLEARKLQRLRRINKKN